MRRPIRFLIATAAAAAAAGLAPAAQAATDGHPARLGSSATTAIDSGSEIPPDCTVSHPDSASASLTCTGRAAGDQWQVKVICFIPANITFSRFGEVVTGNGTSTASCGEFILANTLFHDIAD